MGTITVREGVAFGQSTEADRAAWNQRHWADTSDLGRQAMRHAGASGSLADAYAYGWLGALKAHGVDRPTWERVYALAAVFGAEYEHARWLYLTERTFCCSGYMRAWEDALAANGLV